MISFKPTNTSFHFCSKHLLLLILIGSDEATLRVGLLGFWALSTVKYSEHDVAFRKQDIFEYFKIMFWTIHEEHTQ